MARLAPLSRTACIRIGCAGWSIPRDFAQSFPEPGTHLQRYATGLNAVEINSSFYRPHRAATYARWASSVPTDFRFSVKVPKQITHERRLRDASDAVAAFVTAVQSLGDRLGCLLVQLPPSLAFDAVVAESFFVHLRHAFAGPVVCEPRHGSWFSAEAEVLLRMHEVGRVAADPAPHAGAAQPSASDRIRYYRLHGSPQMYYSSYDMAFLAELATRFRSASESAEETWCIFDNTAQGAATENALQLQALIAQQSAAGASSVCTLP